MIVQKVVKKELADASGSDDACVQMFAPGKVGGVSNHEDESTSEEDSPQISCIASVFQKYGDCNFAV